MAYNSRRPWMGGGTVPRVVHGSIAAAAAVLASAAATKNSSDTPRLMAARTQFHTVPMSIPHPPLSFYSCFDPKLFPSLSRILPSKDGLVRPLHSSSALLLPCALISRSSRHLTLSSSLPYSSSPFALIQEASEVSSFSTSAHRTILSLSTGSAEVYSYITQIKSIPYLNFIYSSLTSSPPIQSLHTWHNPISRHPNDNKENSSLVSTTRKPVLTVVLLGWLGAEQKHLKKYAEWYNARGIQAVTFVIPMTDVLSFNVVGKAEEQLDTLAHDLAQWLCEKEGNSVAEGEKQLMFHTFSNTGWLTYGAILEKLEEHGGHLVGRIKGCVIDSAPVPDLDPQVWASGFSAALLKKRSSATKSHILKVEPEEGMRAEGQRESNLARVEYIGIEAALLSVLEGFFSLFLKLPAINQRLSEVVTKLQKNQPPCPQLYIYSTADRVIPAKAVEAFIEEQRKAGHVVKSCNLQSSPHVDHFRSHPQLYGDQLSQFLKEVLPPEDADCA